ncbi:hypothetical protein [Priestia megaterium]|uniref:hypothetical protein n=1 Tax=Priestia megaterium TaxID=1404 RepID=UPI000BFB59E9|nr:hypothetical protein [Priestia megaterium]PGO60591.1 hypothetical protein CN981_08565 [Priestia megaterium]
MGILEILTILFIALKLFGVIAWSWWLVLLPEIIAVVFYILIPIVFGAGALMIFKSSRKRK